MASSNNQFGLGDDAIDNPAYTHLATLIKGSRVRLPMPHRIEFPAGLNVGVEEFLEAIKTLPVDITHMWYDEGLLRVEFDMYRQRGEVQVWYAVDQLTKYSRTHCYGCGRLGRRQLHGSEMRTICYECIRSEEKLGITGTWLDKY